MGTEPEERLPEAHPDLVKEALRSLTQTKFNRFIATLWQHHGWETTTNYSNADVLAIAPENEKIRYALHTPEYRTRQEISGGQVARYAEQHEASEGVTPVIVTIGRFAKDAEQRAKTVGANLVDGDDLINKIEWANAYETVYEYAPILVEADSISEIEATLDQRNVNTNPRETLNRENESYDSGSLLTSLPWIDHNQHWARRLVVSIASFLVLVSIYNTMPAEGSAVTRLARVMIYFSTIGSLTGVIISFYMDVISIRQAETYWNPSPLLYGLLIPFTFGTAWLFYFYKRRYHFGKATARPPQ